MADLLRWRRLLAELGNEELRLPRLVRWLCLALLVVALVGDLHLIISTDGAPAGPVELGDYFAAVLAFLLGVAVVQRPRWTPVIFLPLLVVMAGHYNGYGQILFALLVLALAAYSAPFRIFLVLVVGVLAWQVSWLVASRPEGLEALWTTLPLSLLPTVPGLVLRVLVRRRGVVSDEALAQALREERRSMARELHDVVAHELTIIAMQARVAERSSDDTVREETLRSIGDHSRRAITELSRLLGTLRQEDGQGAVAAAPEGLSAGAGASLRGTLDEVLERLEEMGIPATVDVDGDLEDVPFGLRSTIRLLVMEGTTNAIKHGDARLACRVAITVGPKKVTVVMRNEVTERARLPRSGFGLAGLRERVTTLRGRFEAGTEGREWVMRATLPVR